MQSTKNVVKELVSTNLSDKDNRELTMMQKYVSQAFDKITPFWPLKNLIAVNPLRGFENLSFEEALGKGMHYFQHDDISIPLQEINKETIKWCQAFFDEGQATIRMPLRDKGLYQSFKHLALYDNNLIKHDDKKYNFLSKLPATPQQAILICLNKLGVAAEQYTEFLTLLLTTLPGWASYINYRTKWAQTSTHPYSITQIEYMAMRIIITYLLWPEAIDLYHQHINTKSMSTKRHINNIVEEIEKNEHKYRDSLVKLLEKKRTLIIKSNDIPKAQLVFCIDVRSEPFRRAIEAQGNYETFGFAGFFGIPAQIKNELDEFSVPSCPVLVSPKHTINENIACDDWLKSKILQKKKRVKNIKYSYQMLKYTFITPFTLVEVLGVLSGLWMLMRTIAPITAKRFKQRYLEFSQEDVPVIPVLKDSNQIYGISFKDQCIYAENFLRMIGLTKQFAPLILLCGHGADTENNAYHSALECGACGGRNGAPNARILASILNDDKIRNYLAEKNIHIPKESIFIPALHNTTTDEIKIYKSESLKNFESIEQLELDLLCAREKNNQWRSEKLALKNTRNNIKHIQRRSSDWAQTRHEWGLARNTTFIVGPRNVTENIDLDGRAFLHSYDWEEDKNGDLLDAILTAPMIVAQWINYQYLFSTINNIAYGSGSKITHNIAGKIGVVQGNASDLMHGLPLQAVNQSDKEKYHEPIRLLTVVYAPRIRIDNIISKRDILKNLFRNAWVSLICIDPSNNVIYSLTPDLSWDAHNIKKHQEQTDHV